jgi:preprotein translocase subunit SecG
MVSMSLLGNMFLVGSIAQGIYGAVLLLVGLFLICLILLQRGRGGGLAGAFGGMGGQSAFGSKAGDAFTHFTIVVAALWIVVCILGTFIGSNTEAEVFSTQAPTGEATEGEPANPATDGAAPEGSTESGTEAPASQGAGTTPNENATNSTTGSASAEGEITSNPTDAPAGDSAPSESSSTDPPPADATPPK